jgi:hypothetical protein
MQRLKKFITASVLGMSVLSMTIVASPVSAVTVVDGDLIKTKTNSAVYYVQGGKSYVFPNENTYRTWFVNSAGKADFKSVTIKIVTDAELNALPFSGVVRFRPGTAIYKFSSTATDMYAVEPGSKLRLITAAQAAAIYGTDWQSKVFIGSNFSFNDYSITTPLTGTYPIGMVLNPTGTSDLYYWDGTNYRKFANDSALLANGMSFKYVVSSATAITAAGAPITGSEAALNNTTMAVVGGSVATTVGGTGLTVALASDTPAAQTVIVDDTADNAQAYIPFLKLNFTAASDGDMTVKTLKLKRTGLPSLDTDLSNIQLWDGTTKLADYSSFTTQIITFNNAAGLFTVPKGTTKAITVTADIADSTVGSHNIKLSVEAASDVVTTTGAVSGSFPMTSNMVTTADIGANLLATGIWATVANGSGLTPGDTNQELWRFKLTGANKKIDLKKVKLTMVGTIANTDITNLKLTQNGVQLGATALTLASDKTVTFDLTATPFEINKVVKEFILRGDIVAGTARTYKFGIQSQDDTEIWDKENNVRIKPGAADSWTVIEAAAATTIASGSLTVTKTLNTSTGDIANDGLDQVISTFDFKAVGEAIKVTHIFVEANTTGGGGLDNGKIYADGAQVGNTTDLTEDTAKDFSLGNSLIIPAGTTVKVQIRADVKTTSAGTLTAGDTIAIYLSSADNGGADGNATTHLRTVTMDTANAGGVAGYTRTVRSGALTTSKNPVVGSWSAIKPTGVKGASQVLIASFTATVGSGEDVYLDDVRIKDTDSEWATDIQNLNVTVNGTPIGTTVSTPAVNTVYTFSINPRIKALKSSSNVINVYADLKSDATLTAGTEAVYMTQVSATGVDTSSDDKDANSREGQMLYVATNGTLTVSLAEQPSSTQLVMGSTSPVAVAKFNFEETSGSEAMVLKTLKIHNTTTHDYNLTNYSLWDGATQVGTTVNSVSGTTTFTGLDYTIPASGVKSLTVKALANYYGTAIAGESEVIQIGLGIATVVAEGAASGPVTTTIGTALSGNTFKVYRTSLAAAKGSVSQDGVGIDNSVVRNANQAVAQIKLVANSAYNAKLRAPLAVALGATTSISAATTTATASTAQSVDGSSTLWTIHGIPGTIESSGLGFDTGSATALVDANSNVVYDRASFWIYSTVDLSTTVMSMTTAATNILGANGVNVDLTNATTAARWYFIDMAMPVPLATHDWVTLNITTDGSITDGSLVYVDQFKLYNDSINFDISGNLAASYATSDALPFYLKDASGVTKATGYFAGTATGAPTAGTVTLFADADIPISNVETTYTLYTNTNTLLLAEAGAVDSLHINLDLGTAAAAGDFKWYDGAVAQDGTSNYISWVLGNTTPINFDFAY